MIEGGGGGGAWIYPAQSYNAFACIISSMFDY
jgi:hypothetical protein